MIILISILDAKMVQKRSTIPTVVPTIPASDDHTDNSWNDTDIYSGELFLNIPDQKLFIRIDASIIQIPFVGGGLKRKKIVVPFGGQSVFITDTDILGDFEVFEDGLISDRVANQTDTNEITLTTTVPEGSIIIIHY